MTRRHLHSLLPGVGLVVFHEFGYPRLTRFPGQSLGLGNAICARADFDTREQITLQFILEQQRPQRRPRQTSCLAGYGWATDIFR